jgi:hypothetical protein
VRRHTVFIAFNFLFRAWPLCYGSLYQVFLDFQLFFFGESFVGFLFRLNSRERSRVVEKSGLDRNCFYPQRRENGFESSFGDVITGEAVDFDSELARVTRTL